MQNRHVDEKIDMQNRHVELDYVELDYRLRVEIEEMTIQRQ